MAALLDSTICLLKAVVGRATETLQFVTINAKFEQAANPSFWAEFNGKEPSQIIHLNKEGRYGR